MSNDTTKQLSLFDAIEVPLTKGYVALIDPIDADLLQYKWHVRTQKLYAARGVGGQKHQKKLYMHRVILERMLGRAMVRGEEVDHINLNNRDNRRENLRLATHKQNMHNMKRLNTNTTGFKGVSFVKRNPNRPYRAYIVIDDKQKHLGFYASAKEAHAAYCKAAIEAYGEFARFE